MRRYCFVAVAAIAALLTLGQLAAPDPVATAQGQVSQDQPNQDQAAPDAQAQIERGRYITHHVSMCVECHTPRDANGNRIESRLFKGAPIPVSSPPFPHMEWAFQAPDIAGLVGYDDEVELLMTGIVARTGKPPLRPMPSFQMNQEDAEAVVAYLKSLR